MIRDPASFRDPAGRVFYRSGAVYRAINESYAEDYQFLIESGLHQSLSEDRLVVDHVPAESSLDANAHAVIEPTRIPFVSYPYEWSFHQLKDAAKTVLQVQRRAIAFGMTLKDGSAYNIQFLDNRPIWIDTLSFERCDDCRPWIAYRQFCRHFLAPIAMMSLIDLRLGTMSKQYLDGIPLDLASSLLPSKLSKPGLQLHIHMHAKADRQSAASAQPGQAKNVSRAGHLALLESLEGTIDGLKPRNRSTEWGDYENRHRYSPTAWEDKASIVEALLLIAKPDTVWDLGANAGRFSRIAAGLGASVVAWDLDPEAVDQHYLALRERPDSSILPLVVDLTNPSPALGWALEERRSFLQRGPVDAVIALAVIHHLAIGNQVPFDMIADFFARLGRWLIIEFVPREDPQVQRLLRGRTEEFSWYGEEALERALLGRFERVERRPITDSGRVITLWKRQS
ncbi:MAG: class I SAM-dependent methyltransferase [Fimbriimonadaceae bacterium]|nr:class I SAM-dependent methyltransferase [Fimbriimonadaceae bacterium]